MLVTKENFESVLSTINEYSTLGLDCETTGKYWWKHRLFSIIISTPEQEYYFDFNGDTPTLNRSYASRLATVLRRAVCHGANSKFDRHFLWNEGVDIEKGVCSIVRERIIKNNRLPGDYNLDSLGNLYCGSGKDETVDNYIAEHRLFEEELIPGKKKISKNKFFWKVPLEITQKYGEKDARLHLDVGIAQEKALFEVDKLYPRSNIFGSVLDVDKNEQELITTCFNMERVGIKVNVPYTQEAIKYETAEMQQLRVDFRALTGVDYQDSRTVFKKAFEKLGLLYPKTEKGNPSFDKKALATVDNPIADLIRGIRYFEKRIGTYYSSFLYFRDGNDILHPNINQGGTETGRMSYSDPNLQNLPKEDDERDLAKPFLVRGCFQPREGNCFTAIDYKQMEFRMLLDYAGELELINAINQGADPHDATAAATGLSRNAAKTLNFGLLYGMGIEKLAHALKVLPLDAEKMRAQYFGKMPRVQKFIKRVNQTAKSRMYVRNWFGRVCRISDPEFSYILLNHLIQGGCADVVKIAMNRTSDLLTDDKLIIQVHDELLFEGQGKLAKVQEMMDSVYKPQNGMRLITSVDHSFKSWAKKDLVKGMCAHG